MLVCVVYDADESVDVEDESDAAAWYVELCFLDDFFENAFCELVVYDCENDILFGLDWDAED